MSFILNVLITAVVEVFWTIGAGLLKIAGRPLSESGAAEETIGVLIVAAAVIGTLILQ